MEKRKLGLKLNQALQALLGLKVQDPKTKKEVTLPQRLLAEFDSLKQQGIAVENALRNPPSNPNQRLPDEVQLDRLSAIRQERRAWGHVLYLLCISSLLQGSELLEVAQWLSRIKEEEQQDANASNNSREELLPYVLAALLSGLETSVKASLEGLGGPGLPDLLEDRSALNQLNSCINTSTWASPSLQAVVQLQWSLLLVQVVQHDASLGSELRVTEEAVTQSVLKAVRKGNAFVYIVVRLLGWRQRLLDALEGTEEEDSAANTSARLGSDSEDEVDVEFQQYLLSSLHSLLVGTSQRFLTILRKIQRQEEDAAFSSASRSGSSSVERRYDVEAFLDSIALVVRGDVSRSLPFWLSPDGRRSRFLMWAVELREEGHQKALLDLLCALASGGGEGAWQAHALLSSGGSSDDGSDGEFITWNRLWDWAGYYIEGLRSAQGKEQAAMPPSEVALLRSFLKLLHSVAQGSYAAREALLAINLPSNPMHNTAAVAKMNPFSVSSASSSQSSSGTNVLQRLFTLYMCPIPIELKATILDALASFAREGALDSGSAGRAAKVRQQLWTMLESSGILSQNKAQRPLGLSSFGASAYQRQPPQSQAGVRLELEQVEAPNGFYPGTTSFINFLSALVVADTSISGGRVQGDVTALVADLPVTSTTGQIVQTTQPLGAPLSTATPGGSASLEIGLEKYITFVVEAVLLPTVSSSHGSPREFASRIEKWRLVAASLRFLERCLSTFDLKALERPISSSNRRGAEDRETLLRLAVHPGFGVMKRLLSSSKLLNEILAVLQPSLPGVGLSDTAAGYEVVDSAAGKQTVFLATAVKTSMRIVLKALQGQDLFLQVLLPTLAGLVEPEESFGRSSATTSSTQQRSLVADLELETRIGESTSYTAIDSKLLQEYESVVQMALYVKSTRDDLALLAVELLTEVARSNAFSEVDRFADGNGGMGRRKMNRLVGLLEMTDESARVKEGIVRRLDALAETDDEGGAVLITTTSESEEEGDDALQGTSSVLAGGNEAICRAILNLLLANTGSSQTAPNIAHLLLGFDLRITRAEEQVIPSPGPESPRGALHSILDLLRGEQTEDEDDQDEDNEGLPTLLDTHPALAEKTLALVVRLATHPFTSSGTLRYLRTQEDFWGHQIRINFMSYCVPVQRESGEDSLDDPNLSKLARGSVVYADGRSIVTSVDALVSSLVSRQHLLNGIALELHSLVINGQISQAAKLSGALYGSNFVVAPLEGDESDASVAGFIPSQQGLKNSSGSPGIRLLELLQSFDFEWHDERDGLASRLSVLNGLDISQARSVHNSGAASSREYDIGRAIALLAFARKELERQGDLNDARQRATFDLEAAVVLQYVSAQNAHRVISTSRRAALTAWRNVHDLVVSHAALLFRPEARATVVFDCLAALLPRLEGAAPEEDPILADLAAGAILALLTSLRRHRAESAAAAGSSEAVDELPVDRLIVTLRALVGALLRSGTSITARGHLYSALINYLQLARTASTSAQSSGQQQAADDAASLAGNTDFDDGASVAFSTMTGEAERSQPSLLDVRTRSFLASHAERLVPVIARDALDAPDVWRTVAFTLLNRLCALESHTRNRGSGSRSALVLDVLTRGGFLKSFLARLRDMDIDLQEVLRPDPASLNALYVYESQMAFLGRLASTREGAERLLESRLFEVLAQADFLAARPEQDQDFVDLQGFLPAATERYAALLLPALQVTVSVVNAAVSSNRSRAPVVGFGTTGQAQRAETHASHGALQQALALLNAHRESFLVVLKTALEDTTSLSTVEQSQFIVTLLLQVLPILDDEALTPPKPLAAFHSAVLALSAGFLHTSAWKARVVPFTDAEREDEATIAPDFKLGVGGREEAMVVESSDTQIQSLFDANASKAVTRLVTSILSYLESASEAPARISGSDQAVTRPCLTSSLAVPQPHPGPSTSRSRTPYQDEYRSVREGSLRRSIAPGSSRLAAVASLGVALSALDDQISQLEQDLDTADGIKGMLEHGENVRLEEWDRVVRQSLAIDDSAAQDDGGVLSHLGLGQRREIATRRLRSHLTLLQGRSTIRLDSIDLLLVLIHRHFEFYLRLASDLGSGRATSSGRDGVDDFSAPWRAPSTNNGNNRNLLSTTFSHQQQQQLQSLDATSLAKEGGEMVQMVLERLGNVLMTLTGNASPLILSTGAGGATMKASMEERSAFLALVGRKLQALLLVGGADGGEATE